MLQLLHHFLNSLVLVVIKKIIFTSSYVEILKNIYIKHFLGFILSLDGCEKKHNVFITYHLFKHNVLKYWKHDIRKKVTNYQVFMKSL